MPASLTKHSLAVNKFFENVSELKMNGGPKDRKITEYGKFSTSENMENVDGPSRLSPSTYPINNLLKQTKVSRFSPLNLLVCISDSVDFYKHLGYKMCGLSLILKTVNWQQEVFFILKINIFFFFFFFLGKRSLLWFDMHFIVLVCQILTPGLLCFYSFCSLRPKNLCLSPYQNPSSNFLDYMENL